MISDVDEKTYWSVSAIWSGKLVIHTVGPQLSSKALNIRNTHSRTLFVSIFTERYGVLFKFLNLLFFWYFYILYFVNLQQNERLP